MKHIFHQTHNLPAHAPVMPLPGALLFPRALMPLHIFEPRYRAMLREALEKDRVVCVALMKPDVTEARSNDDFHHIAGLGLIRACVQADDGTSNLILQGIARVRIIGFLERVPYRIAEIRELPSEPGDLADSAVVARRIIDFCARLNDSGIELPKILGRAVEELRDPALVADLVTHTFIADPFRRQKILESLNLRDRLRLLERYLAESAGA